MATNTMMSNMVQQRASGETKRRTTTCPQQIDAVKVKGFQQIIVGVTHSKLPQPGADSQHNFPQNMIAQSQSGTGKTAAFVLAMLSRVDATKSHPQVLCLSPTYELAIQIGDVAIRMGQFCPEIKIRFAIRGEKVPKRTILTEHILIGTPGKVVDWALKFRFFDLSKIRVFVLDEADVMIATQGHQDQSIRIRNALTERCQMMFFSSTYDENVMEFAEAIVTNPVTIRLKREEESLDNIKQYYVECKNQDAKYAAIANIYGVATIGQAMIFCHNEDTN
ncbi:ATP-dependent RNA helicase ddx25 [Homalodisca vitripennis]|nr:ATP-dependent RNA helicase ddx25 [Homalodisca vitripennis]